MTESIRLYNKQLGFINSKVGPFQTGRTEILNSFIPVIKNDVLYVLFMLDDDFELYIVSDYIGNTAVVEFIANIDSIANFGDIVDKNSFNVKMYEYNLFLRKSKVLDDIWNTYSQTICEYYEHTNSY